MLGETAEVDGRRPARSGHLLASHGRFGTMDQQYAANPYPAHCCVMSEANTYLLAGQESELERLRLQSRVWEPAGRAILDRIPRPPRSTAVDIGCGAMGWLRVLSDWAGAEGTITGTDIDERMLAAARSFVQSESLTNVIVEQDDLFDTRLPLRAFDLLHARFQIAPLGRAPQQLASYLRLLKPGGWIVLEDPDMSSWKVTPSAPAVEKVIALIRDGFLAGGGNFDAGLALPGLLYGVGLRPHIEAAVVALEPGHPYLRLPIQFANSLRPRLVAKTPPAELDVLIAEAESELARRGTWGTTFTLIQVYAQV